MVSTIKEINKMKTIRPEQFLYNITEWDTAMETGRINIKIKAPNAYAVQQFTQDCLDAALLTPCKSFKREVASMRTRLLEHYRTGTLSLSLSCAFTREPSES